MTTSSQPTPATRTARTARSRTGKTRSAVGTAGRASRTPSPVTVADGPAAVAEMIRTLWEAHVRERTDHAARRPSPHPATLRRRPQGILLEAGVPELVAPFVTGLPRDSGDLVRFTRLSGPTAQELLDRLPADMLEERQNWSPSLGSFLRAAAANPGRVEVFGYLVGPAREDERLSVDGAVVFDVPAFRVSEDHDDGCECRELWAYARDAFGIDDAEYGPDEITPWYDPREPGKAGWRLWWD